MKVNKIYKKIKPQHNDAFEQILFKYGCLDPETQHSSPKKCLMLQRDRELTHKGVKTNSFFFGTYGEIVHLI